MKLSRSTKELPPFFQNMFVEPGLSSNGGDLSFVQKSIPPSQTTDLVKSNLLVEIKATIFRMKADKAPEPEGFNAFFLTEVVAHSESGSHQCSAILL